MDIQKIDFAKFQYMNESICNLKREAFFDSRGKTMKTGVGYVIRLARENLRSHFISQKKVF